MNKITPVKDYLDYQLQFFYFSIQELKDFYFMFHKYLNLFNLFKILCKFNRNYLFDSLHSDFLVNLRFNSSAPFLWVPLYLAFITVVVYVSQKWNRLFHILNMESEADNQHRMGKQPASQPVSKPASYEASPSAPTQASKSSGGHAGSTTVPMSATHTHKNTRGALHKGNDRSFECVVGWPLSVCVLSTLFSRIFRVLSLATTLFCRGWFRWMIVVVSTDYGGGYIDQLAILLTRTRTPHTLLRSPPPCPACY